MRGVATLLLGSLFACRRPAPQPPYPGSLVEMRVRMLPADVRAARVTVSAGAASTTLKSAAGEWHGAVALAPGPHALRIEAFDAASVSLGIADASVVTAREAPARVDATIGGASNRPAISALVVPRTSVVEGDGELLEAHTVPQRGVQLAWTALPEGCGTFAGSTMTSTRWTAAAPGPCTVTATAASAGGVDRKSAVIAVRSRGRPDQYPLRISANGRHLVDRRGRPFLVKGETAWLALVNLTEAEQERYLADRAAKGFNLVEVMLVNHDYTASPNPTPPANRAGEQPFLRPGDFSTPNDAYFSRAAAFVDRAAAHGIAVLVAPLYLGFDGGREGFWQDLIAPVNTREACARFGRHVGARFKEKKNVLWLAGGDFAPPAGSEGEARLWEILQGIRDAGASQPWTGHWNVDHLGGISTDQKRFRAAMALNGVYQYARTYRYAVRAYDDDPPRPVFLLESTYEHEHPRGDLQPFRKAWWWTMFSGGSGVLWSNTFLWMCESARSTYRVEYGDVDHAVSSWAAELESAGTYQAVHLHALLEGLPWERLVPAGRGALDRELIASGQRRGEKHIAAAGTPEGDVLVAYVPPAGGEPRNFAVDLSRMQGASTVRWYDPSTGASEPLQGSLPRSESVEVQTPGRNASGDGDWVLVVESR